VAARKPRAQAKAKAKPGAAPAAGAHVGELKVAAAARAPSPPEVRLVETEPAHEPALVHQEDAPSPGEVEADRAAAVPAQSEAPPTPLTPAENTQLAEVMAHLVFHKSLIRDADKGANVERYLALASDIREGVHLAIDDPYDKCLALVFELVINERMNRCTWRASRGSTTSTSSRPAS
jgi:hypothetical protein